MLSLTSGVLTRLSRVRVTLLYSAALAAVATAMVHLSPCAQQNVIQSASTNLHNLAEGRVGTLVGSAFVNEAGPVYLWLPGVVALLALGELLWHSRRLVLAFAIGHIGATLIVSAGIAVAVAAGLVSASIADAADVGMSYGAVAVLGDLHRGRTGALAAGLGRRLAGLGRRFGRAERRRFHQRGPCRRAGSRHGRR